MEGDEYSDKIALIECRADKNKTSKKDKIEYDIIMILFLREWESIWSTVGPCADAGGPPGVGQQADLPEVGSVRQRRGCGGHSSQRYCISHHQIHEMHFITGLGKK